MKRGYLVIQHRALSTITEITYKNRAKVMVTGVTKVRDVVGHNYYVPSSVANQAVYDNLDDAKLALGDYVLQRNREYEDLYADIDSAKEVM